MVSQPDPYGRQSDVANMMMAQNPGAGGYPTQMAPQVAWEVEQQKEQEKHEAETGACNCIPSLKGKTD